MESLNTHGMKEFFKFQFVRKASPDHHEYTYYFQYDVPIISSGGTYVIETRHLTLTEVRVSALPATRNGVAVDMHWRWLSEKARKDILATAYKYVDGTIAKAAGKMFSWRDVFECKIELGHISNAVKAAHRAGFTKLAWNDCLYSVLGANDWHKTEWTVENVY